MRILDCKSPIDQDLVKGAPMMLDYLCDDCKNDFEELKANLAEQGIVGENADKIIDGLTNGNFDVSVLGLIIADREKSAVDAKVKELTEGATNPNGGKAGASVEKTDAEKMAENIGKSLAESNKASADVLAQYI